MPHMTQRNRKLIGAFLLAGSVVLWSVLATWVYLALPEGLPGLVLIGFFIVAGMGWLPEPSAAHSEFRKDRFVVAFDRNGGASRTFTAAYVVRAVTPGVYTVPAAVVEDMYRPELSARTATGVMEVKAAR